LCALSLAQASATEAKRNTVGYTPYPTEVTDAFVREAAETGVDIFRIFDALNFQTDTGQGIDNFIKLIK
jgi:pyruvate carboxylase